MLENLNVDWNSSLEYNNLLKTKNFGKVLILITFYFKLIHYF